MPNSLAFLPWVFVVEPITIGPLRLLPYRRRKLPGDLPHVSQETIDTVLKTYVSSPKKAVERATLIEYEDWQSGQECPREMRERLWDIRVCLATSALATRVLFNERNWYANYAAYYLVMQNFTDTNQEGYVLHIRQRDGYGTHYWTNDMAVINRPIQAQSCNPSMRFDERLLEALLKSTNKQLIESARNYCEANTDDEGMALHLEMLKLMKAFEGILPCKTSNTDFVKAITRAFSGVTLRSYDGPLKEQWKERWIDRGKANNVLEAWANDFHMVRGSGSHAGVKAPSVAAEHVHLAFGDVIYILLLKKRLQDEGLYAMQSEDMERMERIEGYLVHNPFEFNQREHREEKHPWREMNLECKMRSWSRDIGNDVGRDLEFDH